MNEKRNKISVNLAAIFVLFTYAFVFLKYIIHGKFISSFPYATQILTKKLLNFYYDFYMYGLSIVAVTPFLVLLTGFILFKYNKKWLTFVTGVVVIDEIYMLVNNIGEFSLYSLLGVVSLILLINAIISNEHHDSENIIEEYKGDEQGINKLYKFDKKYSEELFKEKNIMIMLFVLLAVSAFGIMVMVIIMLVQQISGELYTYMLSIFLIIFVVSMYYFIFFNKNSKKNYKEAIVFLLGPIYQYYCLNGVLYRRNKLLKKEEAFKIKSVSYNDEAYFCSYVNDEEKGKKKNRLVIPNYYPGIENILPKMTKLSLSKTKSNGLCYEYDCARFMLIAMAFFRLYYVEAGLIDLNYFLGFEKIILIVFYFLLPILLCIILFVLSKTNVKWLKASILIFLPDTAYATILFTDFFVRTGLKNNYIVIAFILIVYSDFIYFVYGGVIAAKKLNNDFTKSYRKKGIDEKHRLFVYDKRYAGKIFVRKLIQYIVICILLITITIMLWYTFLRNNSVIFIIISFICLFVVILMITLIYKPYIFGYKYSFYRIGRWIYRVTKDEYRATKIYTDLYIEKELSNCYKCVYIDCENKQRKLIIPKYYPKIENIIKT